MSIHNRKLEVTTFRITTERARVERLKLAHAQVQKSQASFDRTGASSN